MPTKLLYVLLAFFFIVPYSVAQQFSLRELPAASADGRSTNARFAMGMSRDNGTSYTTSAKLSDVVKINAAILPNSEHIGLVADIFIVAQVNGGLSVLDANSNFRSWNGSVADLVPYLKDVPLTGEVKVGIFAGAIGFPVNFELFIGYQPRNGQLQYSQAPLALNIVENSLEESPGFFNGYWNIKEISNDQNCTGEVKEYNYWVKARRAGNEMILHSGSGSPLSGTITGEVANFIISNNYSIEGVGNLTETISSTILFTEDVFTGSSDWVRTAESGQWCSGYSQMSAQRIVAPNSAGYDAIEFGNRDSDIRSVMYGTRGTSTVMLNTQNPEAIINFADGGVAELRLDSQKRLSYYSLGGFTFSYRYFTGGVEVNITNPDGSQSSVTEKLAISGGLSAQALSIDPCSEQHCLVNKVASFLWDDNDARKLDEDISSTAKVLRETTFTALGCPSYVPLFACKKLAQYAQQLANVQESVEKRINKVEATIERVASAVKCGGSNVAECAQVVHAHAITTVSEIKKLPFSSEPVGIFDATSDNLLPNPNSFKDYFVGNQVSTTDVPCEVSVFASVRPECSASNAPIVDVPASGGEPVCGPGLVYKTWNSGTTSGCAADLNYPSQSTPRWDGVVVTNNIKRAGGNGRRETTYVDGRKVGPDVGYEADGSIYYSANYVNNVLDGEFFEKISGFTKKGFYKNGRAHGVWTTTSTRTGEVVETRVFENGTQVSGPVTASDTDSRGSYTGLSNGPRPPSSNLNTQVPSSTCVGPPGYCSSLR